ncbi:MAG: hypothetical protein M0R03_01160 [Novosphingobium sp.]|nr:hypothetical protein [Novosphingobium sp.]
MAEARLLIALAVLGAASACGSGANDPGPGGVTVGEAKALDDAAKMLDERRLPDEALQPAATAVPSGALPSG